jgi:hypothetical protein
MPPPVHVPRASEIASKPSSAGLRAEREWQKARQDFYDNTLKNGFHTKKGLDGFKRRTSLTRPF